MKRFLGTLAAMALLASPAAAQRDGTFDFISGTSNHLDFQGQWVAPQGNINMTLNSAFAIFCVDQNNFAIAAPYPAWSTTVADNNALLITHTRIGQVLGEQAAYERYWRSAYLVEQYLLLAPASQTASVQRSYQEAIWNVTNGNLGNTFGSAVALANSALAITPTLGGVTQWAVITDVNTIRGQGGGQEFIWVGQGGREEIVPEPATMTLLATGLAGMAAANRRRRANKK